MPMNTTIITLLIIATVAMLILAAAIILVIMRNHKSHISINHNLALATDAIANLQEKSTALTLLLNERNRTNEELRESLTRLLLEQQQEQHKQRTQLDEHQIKNLQTITESLQSGINGICERIITLLRGNNEELGKRVDKLTQETNLQLKEISGRVDRRLSEGFEKTTATFTDVVKRLALIDEAQKKITELSSNVISLQEILNDKRSRGAFGEIQLETLVRNVLPANGFALQHTLSNGKRVDCMLLLPEPSGNISIDAKFPLESYQRFSDHNASESERTIAQQQFRLDIRKHIQDIAEKYIVPGETTDGALMFIPAEAIFAEIHAYYPDLIEQAHRAKVWMVSPNTMMAVITTARAVLKDAATRKQVHIIQQHLIDLGKDFGRFRERMDKLAAHIKQAHDDVDDVNRSSYKISSRFNKIEKVDLTALELDQGVQSLDAQHDES
jgi:DNA recombination protein RmuC